MQEICRIKFENYKIKLYDCINGHVIDNIKLTEFKNTQNVNISIIICNKYNIENKGNTPNNKFYISCHYFVKYFITKFENEYSLEELIALSDYYKQFQNVNQVIEEIKNNQFNQIFGPREQVFELEDPKKIKVVINFPNSLHSSLPYDLNKKEKTEEEKIQEYKAVIAKWEARNQINGMKSIIVTTDRAIEYLKAWITPINHLKAVLLYNFNISYPKKLEYSIFSGYNFTVLEEQAIKDFHSKCDGVQSILVICKSGTQIFGGYTPLAFSSDNTYKNDNDSFLFSLNHYVYNKPWIQLILF